jgi:hypothetical protein
VEPTEHLTQQSVDEVGERVAAILGGPGNGAAGQAVVEQAGQQAGQQANQPAANLTSTRPAATRQTTKPTRAASKRTGTPNQAASTTADALPSVNISLPAEVYAYFQKQADADERTLAKYMQRLVRQEYARLTQPVQSAATATELDEAQ